GAEQVVREVRVRRGAGGGDGGGETILPVVRVRGDDTARIGDRVPRAVGKVGVADAARPAAVGERLDLPHEPVQLVPGTSRGERGRRIAAARDRLVHLLEV